jgi:DNA-binding NarL/FixJ family response regulator
MATSLLSALAELRSLGRPRQRRMNRGGEALPLLVRLIGACRIVAAEERAGGVALRLQGETEQRTAFTMICIVPSNEPSGLTTAEQAVVDLLCEGRTRAQIARLRGVSANTVKSQIREIFRKLNVDSRVALVRRCCA